VAGAAFGSNYAQRYKLSYKDRTLLIGCGVAGIAAAFNAQLQVFYLLSIFCCRCQYSGITPIMIAAATGALVSEIVLDETVLLNFKQQQVFDYHKILLYPSRNFDWFYVGILYPLLSKNRTLFW
jgi:CIC family chloride channel protein